MIQNLVKTYEKNTFFIDFVILFGVTSSEKALLKQQKRTSKPYFLKQLSNIAPQAMSKLK